MPTTSVSSPERFDRLREERPDLALTLYAMDPGGLVTLEVITPEGEVFTFLGPTAAAAMRTAFPEPTTDQPTTDIFA